MTMQSAAIDREREYLNDLWEKALDEAADYVGGLDMYRIIDLDEQQFGPDDNRQLEYDLWESQGDDKALLHIAKTFIEETARKAVAVKAQQLLDDGAFS